MLFREHDCVDDFSHSWLHTHAHTHTLVNESLVLITHWSWWWCCKNVPPTTDGLPGNELRKRYLNPLADLSRTAMKGSSLSQVHSMNRPMIVWSLYRFTLTLASEASRQQGHERTCVCHHHSSDFSPSVCNAWAFVMVELFLLWYFINEIFAGGLCSLFSLLQSCRYQSDPTMVHAEHFILSAPATYFSQITSLITHTYQLDHTWTVFPSHQLLTASHSLLRLHTEPRQLLLSVNLKVTFHPTIKRKNCIKKLEPIFRQFQGQYSSYWDIVFF